MGKYCGFEGCKSNSDCDFDISFHRLPTAEDIRKKWLDAIPANLLRSHTTYVYICSKHFTPDSYQPEMPFLKKILKRTAVPTLFDFTALNNKEVISDTKNDIGIQTDLNAKDAQVQTSLKRLKPSERKLELQRKNHILHKRLHRREKCITIMKHTMQYLKSNDCSTKDGFKKLIVPHPLKDINSMYNKILY